GQPAQHVGGSSRFHDPLGANQSRWTSGQETGRITPYCFASDEWIDAWVRAFNANPKAVALCQRLLGRWRFEVERDRTGPGGVWDVVVDVDGARLVAVDAHQDSAADLRGHVRASHDRWHRLLNGSADLRMSILTRRVHVTGDLKELRTIAKQLLDAGFSVKTVPTMFLCGN
ncbi:SCP2 sterol-binding domain-containing protein, partial [Stomatohabitans albus]